MTLGSKRTSLSKARNVLVSKTDLLKLSFWLTKKYHKEKSKSKIQTGK
jgi:hypothetical protein